MKPRGTYTVVAALTLGLLASTPAQPQDDREPHPRIGLVLSGGGALGSAHVGVLKVLEELRIPVHCIAGTSMGAIVGGLHAAGVSPDEMEVILAETDWRYLFDDRPPRRELPYRRKVDDQTFLARFEVGFNRGSFQLPPGLISGQKLGFALQMMTLNTAGVDDFDNLPIPFRAVATDIATGEMVVLGKGNLGRAIRASMSIPGVFSPIEIDGRLLVDGGLVRNLPVDVVRGMGAEVVIAVDVGQPLLDKSELASIAKVTSQMVDMQIRRNVQEQTGMADVLVKPDLEGFESSQFERAVDMIPLGEKAAREAAPALSQFSVSESEFSAYLERARQKKPPPQTVAAVQVTMSSTADPKLVMRRINMRPGAPFDPEVIRQDLKRLYETGDYERVEFFLSEADGSYTLHIDAYDKSWGPNYLRFGLNLFADFEGESSFEVLASYNMTRLNRLRGELKLQVRIGENPTIRGEFYQPLSQAQKWFIAPSLQQSTSTVLAPFGGGLLARYRTDTVVGIVDLGLQLGKYAELRLGLARRLSQSELRGGQTPLERADPPSRVETDLGGVRFSAVVDQFDNMNFPRRGYLAVVDGLVARESLGADSEHEQLAVFLAGAATRGRHTLLGLSRLNSALGSDAPELFALGGLFSLSGYPFESIVGRYGGAVSLLYLYRLFELPPVIGDGLYVGASVEAGNLWQDAEQVSLSDLRYAGSVYVGLDTMFGPLYLAAGFGEGGSNATYLYVGRTF